GEDGSIVVDSAMDGSLNITHVSTALQVLSEQAFGGAPTNDEELAEAQSLVNGADLINMAAVIKTYIDNPSIPFPAGSTAINTLALVSDPVEFDTALDDLETNFPAEFEQAIEDTATSVGIGYSEDEVPGILYTALANDLVILGNGVVFEFVADNTATVTLSTGASDATWLVNADGEIVVDLTDPPETEVFLTCPAPVNAQCRALFSTTQITLIRIADGVSADQVFLLQQTTITYPDDPIPDEVVDSVPGSDTIYVAFRDDGFVPVEESDVNGLRIAIYYFRQGNDSVGLVDSALFGADFLNFDANGTGSTERRGFVFNWSINSDGSLAVDFVNGDTNRYVFYRESGEVASGLVIGTVSGTDIRVGWVERIAFDGLTEFTNANLENRRYRSIVAVLDPDFAGTPEFDFLFLPGGTGCRRTSFNVRDMTWSSTPQNFMDSLLFLPGFVDPWQRRSWEAITITSGVQGDRYWVIENLDTSDLAGPYVFADPHTTPGRINAYEFTEDLTNSVDPCL
ncbi:MAG: hypothetical protein KJO31_06190, partial [Gammaproteobacteria bacterium]|nr:hypothetical protein [Gammaproteobacteria bacterium]